MISSWRRVAEGHPGARPIGTLVGLLVAFYAFPTSFENVPVAVLGLLLTVAGLALLTRIVAREVALVQAGRSVRSTSALASLLVLVVVSFSFAFVILDQTAPRQVVGLETRTDALYFTVSTMTTVGYGDVHAEGQAARVLVIALIVFNVVVVAGLLRALTTPAAPTSSTPER